MKKPADAHTNRRKWYTGNIGNIFWWTIGAVMIITVYASEIQDDIHIDKETHLYGVKVYGRITGLYTETERRYQPHYAHLVYAYNGVTYSKEIGDNQYHYKVDDTIIVICSTRDSAVIKLKGEIIKGVDYPKNIEK